MIPVCTGLLLSLALCLPSILAVSAAVPDNTVLIDSTTKYWYVSFTLFRRICPV